MRVWTRTAGICHQMFIEHLLWASTCAKRWEHGRNHLGNLAAPFTEPSDSDR